MTERKEIQRAQDPHSPTVSEQKHVPVIEAPQKVKASEPFEVSVAVGSLLHVMEREHYIQWLELYADGDLLTKVTFAPLTTQPRATVTLVLEGSVTLRALESCNLHGLWESRREITVG